MGSSPSPTNPSCSCIKQKKKKLVEDFCRKEVLRSEKQLFFFCILKKMGGNFSSLWSTLPLVLYAHHPSWIPGVWGLCCLWAMLGTAVFAEIGDSHSPPWRWKGSWIPPLKETASRPLFFSWSYVNFTSLGASVTILCPVLLPSHTHTHTHPGMIK